MIALQDASATNSWSAGQMICGSVWSSKTTLKVQSIVLPLLSSAVIVTICSVKCPLKTAATAGLCVRIILPVGRQSSSTIAKVV